MFHQQQTERIITDALPLLQRLSNLLFTAVSQSPRFFYSCSPHISPPPILDSPRVFDSFFDITSPPNVSVIIRSNSCHTERQACKEKTEPLRYWRDRQCFSVKLHALNFAGNLQGRGRLGFRQRCGLSVEVNSACAPTPRSSITDKQRCLRSYPH